MQRRHGESGFALITVLWGLALIALLSLGVISAARWRIKATGNIHAAARAQALAEAAINLTILHLLTPDTARPQSQPEPRVCALPEGAIAAISVADEGGKVDLNAAPVPLLAALIGMAGAERETAARLALAIVDFRTASPGPARPPLPGSRRTKAAKHGLFQTIYELDQVPGIELALFRAILPYATVHSRQPGIDQRFAAPQLLQVLGSTADIGFKAVSSGRSFLLRAEVALPGNAVFTREALVEMGAGVDNFTIHEWRIGQRQFFDGLKPAQGLQNAGQAGLSPC